jgi:hypothetical protein
LIQILKNKKKKVKKKMMIIMKGFKKKIVTNQNIFKSTVKDLTNKLGTKSIPPLDRLSSLFKGKNYSALTAEEELPVVKYFYFIL